MGSRIRIQGILHSFAFVGHRSRSERLTIDYWTAFASYGASRRENCGKRQGCFLYNRRSEATSINSQSSIVNSQFYTLADKWIEATAEKIAQGLIMPSPVASRKGKTRRRGKDGFARSTRTIADKKMNSRSTWTSPNEHIGRAYKLYVGWIFWLK